MLDVVHEEKTKPLTIDGIVHIKQKGKKHISNKY
jgi:hypothetical protein